MRIAICDDDPAIVLHIHALFDKVASSQNATFEIFEYEAGHELFKACNTDKPFDLIYLDIEIGDGNGIDFACKIRTLSPDPTAPFIVFVSAHQQYYHAAFQVQPYYYVNKPIVDEQFIQMTEKIIRYYFNRNASLTISYRGNVTTIPIRSILFIEVMNKQVYIHTTLQPDPYVCYDTMTNMAKRLERNDFISIHASFLINADHIRTFSPAAVILDNSQHFSIPKTKRKAVQEEFMKLRKAQIERYQ